MTHRTWHDLEESDGGPISLSVDTEFEGSETLCVQFAARVGGTIYVEVYRAACIPAPEPRWFRGGFGRRFADLADRVVVRPTRLITPDLSPGRVLADLLGLPHASHLTRAEGRLAVVGRKRGIPRSRRTTEVGAGGGIHVQLVGHFLRADFFRALGRAFWEQLILSDDSNSNGVRVRDSKVIGLTGTGVEQFRPPVVEYVRDCGRLIPVSLSSFDTQVAFGSGKLDDLAESYLGLRKMGDLTDEDKGRMKTVFRKRPRDAYRYAVADAVLTLLITERMKKLHLDVYRELGFDDAEVPRCHATPGVRVANLLLRDVTRTATGSAALNGSAKSSDAPASLQRIKTLFEGGSAMAIGRAGVSRYGAQTGQTHGGLLFSRSPTKLFHSSDGQLRDLDLSSCYPSILRAMNVYVGRPVVWEPGNVAPTLREVVAFLNSNTAGWDSWFIKLSGDLSVAPNALIPSTNEAHTYRNYKSRAARARSYATQQRWKSGAGEISAMTDRYTTLFTHEVSAGVVVWATWMVIQALPSAVREEYENLRVESVVFYPKLFVANSGPEFDRLREKLATGMDLDWNQQLDLDARSLDTAEDLDDKYTALKYPVSKLAGQLVRLRQDAKRAGKGASMDRALKLTANTLYGALCSPHLATQNVVAAQVITGTARALAFAMAQSLNSHNVITDGVLYRRDQLPAVTFAACLGAHPEYPIRRPEEGVRFLDPSRVPVDDSEFTAWYSEHVKRFFGVGGKDYDFLFGLHSLEHKQLPESNEVSKQVAFDALIIDGAANYIKLVATTGGWKVADFKARSFRPADKKKLATWLLAVCSEDTYTDPPTPVESIRLLTFREAVAMCRQALAQFERAIVPLGMARPRLQTYKLIKPSQFLFRTSHQKKRVMVDWKKLEERTACGPETLALKKTFRGSVSRVAEVVYELIRSGKDQLKWLNIDRLINNREGVAAVHARGVQERRVELEGEFVASLDADRVPASTLVTGVTLTRENSSRLTA